MHEHIPVLSTNFLIEIWFLTCLYTMSEQFVIDVAKWILSCDVWHDLGSKQIVLTAVCLQSPLHDRGWSCSLLWLTSLSLMCRHTASHMRSLYACVASLMAEWKFSSFIGGLMSSVNLASWYRPFPYPGFWFCLPYALWMHCCDGICRTTNAMRMHNKSKHN